MKLKKFIALILFLLPHFRLKIFLLNCLKHRINYQAKLHPSFILCEKLVMGPKASIGFLNSISADFVYMKEYASIKHLNRVKGPVRLYLAYNARFGSKNQVVRAPISFPRKISNFYMGKNSGISVGGYYDCSSSIILQKGVVIGGSGVQIWTHGFIHKDEKRHMTLGKVAIGENSYIGSASVVSPGVKIAKDVIIGAHSSVGKSILEAGVYVSSSLRYLGKPSLDSYKKITENDMDFFVKDSS